MLGAMVGGVVTLGGTAWEHRAKQREAQISSIRSLVSEFIEIYSGSPVALEQIEDPAAFKQHVAELRSALWSPRGRLRLYPEAVAIDHSMHRVFVSLGNLEHPLQIATKYQLLDQIGDLGATTAKLVNEINGRSPETLPAYPAPERPQAEWDRSTEQG